MGANNSSDGTDYMSGPTSQRRIIIQTSLLALLMVFGFLTNGSICALFIRFKSMRKIEKMGLVLDLAIVELLDIMVNIPLFMDYYLYTKKRNLTRQDRWYTMLFHRFFLLNDLATQLGLIIDCFLAVWLTHRYTTRKTSSRVLAFVVLKWGVILALLLGCSIPLYEEDPDEYVSDEAYQRVLFGPNQIIWKAVIPSTLGLSALAIILTAVKIRQSRLNVKKRYGMRVFGGGRRDSSKALATLAVTLITQTTLRVPAISYGYAAVEGDIEGDRWYAFFAYYSLFLSSTMMPVIFYCRTKRFRRALFQLLRHPCQTSAFLDHAASLGVSQHRNGRDFKSKISRAQTTPEAGTRLVELHFPQSTTTSRECTLDTGLSGMSGGMSIKARDSIFSNVEVLDEGLDSVELAATIVQETKGDFDIVTIEGEYTYDTRF